MIQTKWVDRTFDFNFPIGMFPIFLERLRGTLPHIINIIEGRSESEVSGSITGKWSVKQHIGHLAVLDELHILRVKQFMAGDAELKAADMSNTQTEIGNYNQKMVPEIFSLFEFQRKYLIQLLENIDEEVIGRSALHPRLNKQMRLLDMVYFTAEHDDHHLASIRKTITRVD